MNPLSTPIQNKLPQATKDSKKKSKTASEDPKLTADTLLQEAEAGANAWSSCSSDEGEDDEAKAKRKSEKYQQINMKRRLIKAERKQFAQKDRTRNKWDAEYDRGKERKTNRRTAYCNQGWGKAATVKAGSMSDQFQNAQQTKGDPPKEKEVNSHSRPKKRWSKGMVMKKKK